jgi:hypothetical protein
LFAVAIISKAPKAIFSAITWSDQRVFAAATTSDDKRFGMLTVYLQGESAEGIIYS